MLWNKAHNFAEKANEFVLNLMQNSVFSPTKLLWVWLHIEWAVKRIWDSGKWVFVWAKRQSDLAVRCSLTKFCSENVESRFKINIHEVRLIEKYRLMCCVKGIVWQISKHSTILLISNSFPAFTWLCEKSIRSWEFLCKINKLDYLLNRYWGRLYLFVFVFKISSIFLEFHIQ